MKTLSILLLKFLATVFAAEFAAGFVHWFEDAYVREHTPVIGKFVGRPNTIHHHYPRHMTRNSWWHSSWDLVLIATVLLVAAWAVGWLTWQVWLFAILAANANEFHKWAHRTRKENGRVISFLQEIKILQTSRHHALHHTDPKNSHYCTITNALNPVLDAMRFWEGLEWLLAKTIRLPRQPDTSVRGCGPGPAWLKEFSRVQS
ncbi:MAG TPA: fatty acid desaturase CarF family protein [Verrucomicrobiae bacterium]|nr:fatty acid desaturase CarF family protein [Verrucomicrobiae bacterium]